MDVHAAIDWFEHTIMRAHREKLRKEKARLAYQIEQRVEFVKEFQDFPPREQSVANAKTELAELKAKMQQLDVRVLKLWKKPPADVVAKLAKLYSGYSTSSALASIHENSAERHAEAERPIAAKKDAEQAAEYRATADKAKKEFDSLNAKWRVPLDVKDAAHLGLVEMTAPDGGYRVL